MNVLQQLTDAIGPDAAIRLCQTMGGSRLYIPHGPDNDPMLPAVLGEAAAQHLCSLYGGEAVELPSKLLIRQLRNDLIRKEYAQLAPGTGCRASHLARRYGLSRRHVFNIVSAG